MKSTLPHIHTTAGISVVLNGRPYNAAADDTIYKSVVEAVERGEPAWFVLEIFERAAKKLREITGLTPDMLYSGGVVTYKGEVLHNYAADRLIALIEAGRDHKPLARFLEKLQENPSKRVVDNLYAFLEKGNIPLTADGNFLAYKAVRSDYRDIHSGRFDNSVGQTCRMSRNQVDEDQNRTCSAGLHVCSFSYLPHFAHADGHVMMCEVNPAHVVAIPADYNDAKMRVSEYTVVDEVHGYYQDKRDVLGEAGQAHGVMEEKYTLFDAAENDELGSYFTLEEAKRQARDYQQRNSLGVNVEDQDGMVVFSIDEEGDES